MSDYFLEVKKVLNCLEYNNLDYVILRNFDFLNQGISYSGKDVDICVQKKDSQNLNYLFKQLGFIKYPINPFSNHDGYIKFIPSELKLLFFHVHYDGVTGINLQYLPFNVVNNNKIKLNGVYVTSNENLFLVILLHSILDKKRFRHDYIEQLKYLLSSTDLDLVYIESILSTIFSNDISKKIIFLLNNHNFSQLEVESKNIYNNFLNNYSNLYFNLFKVYVLGGIWKLFYILKPKSLISFIGIDGSGKTTISNKIVKILNDNGLSSKYVYTGRGKNNILPIFQISSKVINSTRHSNNLINQNSKNNVLRTVSCFVFSFDLLLRYFFQILPLRIKNNFVITDRYFTDILLMKSVPMFLKQIMYSIFPKPTKTYYLFNDLHILHSRKKDHDLYDLKRQELIFTKINYFVKPIVIKNENIDNSLRQILSSIL